MKVPILVSIPHGGWKVADEIKEIWALSKKDAFHDGDPLTSKMTLPPKILTALLNRTHVGMSLFMNKNLCQTKRLKRFF